MELEEQYRKKNQYTNSEREKEYDKHWVLMNLNSVLGI